MTTNMILKPMRIGDLTIDIPLTLAPMAGQTNRAFRTLCREIGGCGLVCTELLSSNAIHYKSAKTFKMFDWDASENPFAVQLFGADPQVMAEAAQVVAEAGAGIVDINMGCWVPKVAKKQGAGAALLRDVCTATTVVRAIVDAVPGVPVTVKVRAGWDAEHITAIEFAQSAEQAGVKAIAVHARTAEQGFTGVADWDIIRQVKEVVSIPVIGNGDVRNAADARRMFEQTGCDAVMIGRAAMGSPWVFKQIFTELTTGEVLPAPSAVERATYALRHARLAVETSNFDERATVTELRGQITKYHIGVHGAASMRDRLVHASSLADIEAVLLPVIEGGAAEAHIA
jgi:tRNA-dihydrouridine synthase B